MCCSLEQRLPWSGAIWEVFQIHWQQGLVDIQAGDISPEDIHHMLGLAEAFLDEVEGLVEAETNAWIKEFQESSQQIDELSQQGGSG